MSDFLPISGTIEAIFGAESPARVNPASARHSAPVSPADSTTHRADDEVELSDHARFLARLRETSPVRDEAVDQARQNIEAGVYDADAVIDQTIELLSKDLDLLG